MIYDYYCVDCGRKFGGEEISFDLAELLEIQSVLGKDGIKSQVTQVSSKKLEEMARCSGSNLKHGEKCKIELTLKELLEIMGENAGGQSTRELMSTYEYSKLQQAVSMVFINVANTEVAARLEQEYSAALSNKFVCILDEAEEEELEDTSNYRAFFWVEPEFFEDGKSDKLYTVKYSAEKNPVNMKRILAPTQIRGYCPICGQPVLNGSGKYRHTMVGLLGAQSAGKTSLIVAMIHELQKNFRNLGIKVPGNVLCDSRYRDMEMNMTLYRNYWAVRKTLADTSAGTFNASLLLESDDEKQKQIITFIDIAGEQCYNVETQEMNSTALEVYPLINSCQIYLLCTCIDQTGYGNAEGEGRIIPPEAVLRIAQGIYENLRDKKEVPPLCIVATKADMACTSAAGKRKDNPFEKLHAGKEFLHNGQLDIMKNIYDIVEDENIREPLRWCCDTFLELKNKTYISMMSCSALGRKGVLYEGKMEEIAPYRAPGSDVVEPFAPQRLEALLQWILQVAGVLNVQGEKQALPCIPAYGESYQADRIENTAPNGLHRTVWPVGQAKRRILAVRKLFLNWSELDRKMYDAYTEELTLFEKLRGVTQDGKVKQIVLRYNNR